MVDEEPSADRGTGMDLDPREKSGELRENARRRATGPALDPQAMGQAMNPDRVQAGVDDRVLDVAAGRRVVGARRGEVLTHSA